MTILCAISSSIKVFSGQIISPVFGSTISWHEKRPTNLSNNGTIAFFWPGSLTSSTNVPWSVPQSSSRIITSWETSTNLLVKYPESAVFNAVSAPPLRAPWVAIKNSETVKPSRKHDLIGNSIVSPDGLDIKPRRPDNCKKLDMLPRAPESLII